MMTPSSSITFRDSVESDLENLKNLIHEATNGESKVTAASLLVDLFQAVPDQMPEVEVLDPCIEFDTSLIRSDQNPAQAYVAEVDSKLVGYVIFHYHYSPWSGHYSFIDHIYVLPEYRKRGVAGKLVDKVFSRSKEENLTGVFFATHRMESWLLERIHKCNPCWYRSNQYDWSVCRIRFE